MQQQQIEINDRNETINTRQEEAEEKESNHIGETTKYLHYKYYNKTIRIIMIRIIHQINAMIVDAIVHVQK